jgi:hypothetical protein
MLPTVTQSVNRQVILSLGMTRESLHFNSPTEFYPLAHIAEEAQNDLQDAFNTFDRNFYNQLVQDRLKRQSYLNRSKIPIFYQGQLVFLKNQEPAPGSTILKLPYKGPYRVKTINPRNVQLVDLETGRDVTSYYEFLKPLSLKEFRLLLTKGWDLNLNNEKRTRTLGSIPVLDTPLGLIDRASVLDEERQEDNQNNEDSDHSDKNTKIIETPNDPDEIIPYDDPRFNPYEGSSSNIETNFEPSLFDSHSGRNYNLAEDISMLPNSRPPPKPNLNSKKQKMQLQGSGQQQMQQELRTSDQPNLNHAVNYRENNHQKRPSYFKAFLKKIF